MIEHAAKQLGNYRLIRRLGQGGFAEVYLGEHVYLKTYAAIKVLQTRLASDKQEAFLAEARSIARLKHANIVRVLEFGVEGNTPFLVMDYAPNGSLRQHHLPGTRLSPTEILPYVKQISAALQYAHEHKLIHCDVKPENMLLGPRNEALLSDFGIAQVVQSTRSLNAQEIVGTIMYMAPELFQDQPLPASDQYALAAVVYEWLSGDFPFHGSFTEIASQHLLVPPPPFHEKGLEVPTALEEVVMRALAKDPGQRFASVREFAASLEQSCQADRRTGVALPLTSSPALISKLPTAGTLPSVPTSQQSPIDTPQPLPVQQKPRRPRLPVGTLLLLIIVALLSMASGSGLTYYVTVLHPAQLLPAQTTITAQSREALATAEANAAAKAAQDIYIRATNGKPVFTSPLSTNDTYNWLEYDSKDFGSCTFKEGAYHASTSLGSPYDFCTPVKGTNFSNFAFQAEMTIVRGDMGGLIFRDSYNFFIDEDGSYVFTVTNYTGATTTLLNSFSSAIKTGLNQSNLITVVARGSSFYLYVNKQYIGYVSDSTSSSGSIGVAAQNAKHVTEVAFHNAQIWNL